MTQRWNQRSGSDCGLFRSRCSEPPQRPMPPGTASAGAGCGDLLRRLPLPLPGAVASVCQGAGSLNRQDAELRSSAVYGLPEWNGPAIADAKLVAAPGCFPTASLLPRCPSPLRGLIETSGIIIDAKTAPPAEGACRRRRGYGGGLESIAPSGESATATPLRSSRWRWRWLARRWPSSRRIWCRWCVVFVHGVCHCATLASPPRIAPRFWRRLSPPPLRSGSAGGHLSATGEKHTTRPLFVCGHPHRPAGVDERH